MTKRSFGVLVVTAFLAAVGASAQNMEANIPFNFRVGESLMPAGAYTVSHLGPSGTVMVKSVDQKSAAIVITNATESNRTPTIGKLVFRRYGDAYFLGEIWRPGYQQGRLLTPARAEREVARAIQRPGGTELASVPAAVR